MMEGKYGTAANFEAKLKPNEPWFAFRSQDKLAPLVIAYYVKLLRENKLHEQADHCVKMIERMDEWQKANGCRLPT